MALCSTLYDVLEDVIVDCSLHPDLSSERSAALDHLSAFFSLDLADNSIIIYDPGYYSEKMYRFFVQNNILCLMRLKENMTITRSDSDDSVIMLSASKRPLSGTPDSDPIPIRIIRVVLDSGVTEYLATNVMDPDLYPEMFKELYFLRWKTLCELCPYTNHSGRNDLNISIPASESSYKTLSPGQGFWTVPLHHLAIVAPLPE